MNGSTPDGHKAVANAPGQDALHYRVDDFTGFRRALLRPLDGERELTGFAPVAGDLGLQILEWWAYLADILTSYNERIANESYLRTATRAESLDRLVRVLGYRPRPGIAATGQLAALRRPGRANEPLVVPAGTAITSTPTPGVAAQTFETVADAAFTGPAAVPVTLVDPHPAMAPGSVLLAGKVTGVKHGDRLLLLPTGWNGQTDDWALVTVDSATHGADPSGKANTRVTYASVDAGTDPGALAVDPTTYRPPASYRLLRMTASATWWPHGDATTPWGDVVLSGAARSPDEILQPPTETLQTATLQTATLQTAILQTVAPVRFVPVASYPVLALAGDRLTGHLAAAVRAIAPGDIVLVDGGPSSFPALVTNYTEQLWFVWDDGTTHTYVPSQPPPRTVVPVPHSVLTLTVPPSVTSAPDPSSSLPRFALRDVGTMIATPPAGTANLPWPVTVRPDTVVPPTITAAFLEDATGVGLLVTVSPGDGGALILSVPAGTATPTLTAPLRLLLDVVAVSRGTSVPMETLGGGDARVAGQEFTLAKSPLTYLAAGAGYASTLRIWVNGVAWTEVDTFYGQPPDARVFVTRELPGGPTTVRFGDGVNGAKLPTGTGNVVASYRYGSGQTAPGAGRLTAAARPLPNLAGFRNPVAVAGGADPDPPSSLRAGAPASTLTFGRAVSAADYEMVAARTAGVRRAKAVWAWNGGEQRALVTVYVGDDDAAPGFARAALAGSDDPNRPVRVVAAIPVDLTLACTLVVRSNRKPGDVLAAAQAALLDPMTGLFSPAAMPIGGTLYRSRLDAVLSVDGVVAVRGLDVSGPADLITYPPPAPMLDRPPIIDTGPVRFAERRRPRTAVGIAPIDLPPIDSPPIDIPPIEFRPPTALTDQLTPIEGGFFRLAPEQASITAVVASSA